MIRTFIDSGVLISAATGRDALFDRAWEMLDDPERVFLTSEFVRLEVLPKATYFGNQDELELYEAFFAAVEQTVLLSDALVAQAHLEARRAGLAALRRHGRCAGRPMDVLPLEALPTDNTSPCTTRVACSVRVAVFRPVATADSEGCTTPARCSDGGQPCGRRWEEKRHPRALVPRDALHTGRSSFRLLREFLSGDTVGLRTVEGLICIKSFTV